MDPQWFGGPGPDLMVDRHLRGPAPLVRLAFFASLSLTLLVLDARFGYAEAIRSVLALAAYPIQQVARLPVALAEGVPAASGRFNGSG